MITSQSIWRRALTSVLSFLAEPLTYYSLVVGVSISFFIFLEGVYPDIVEWTSSKEFYWLQTNYPIFVTTDDREFSLGFLEWFGVFYGFLLPLLLLRAWEQLDRADREFDREADTIKVLLEDILLLDDKNFLSLKRNMAGDLKAYIQHVLAFYKLEHYERHSELRNQGNFILQGIRANYKDLIYRGGGESASRLEPVTTELLDRLNDAIDVRGDRISIFGQRLFETFKLVAIVTSIIWLVPFYFLDYQSGLFGSLLKLATTFLIILVLTVIDDLDEPFSGPWKISTNAWLELQKETNIACDELEKKAEQAPSVVDSEEPNKNHRTGKINTSSGNIFELLLTAGLSLIYLFLLSPKHKMKY